MTGPPAGRLKQADRVGGGGVSWASGVAGFAAAARSLYCRPRMPKMKSHSGAKKRFKLTGTGKVQGRHAFSSHILEKKSPKRKRSFALDIELSKSDQHRVKRMLGGNGR